jgi:hypothetical protein
MLKRTELNVLRGAVGVFQSEPTVIVELMTGATTEEI